MNSDVSGETQIPPWTRTAVVVSWAGIEGREIVETKVVGKDESTRLA